MSIPKFFHSLLNLFFPPLCLHCREIVSHPRNPLCKNCYKLMDFIDPKERCSYCFVPLGEGLSQICYQCRTRYPAYYSVASTFDYLGPAATLIKHMKYQGKPWIAKGIAAYLYYQFLKLDWPAPDLIVSMPICRAHWIERGYNQSALITEEFANLINRPSFNYMKRRSGEFSQAGKSRYQRKQLSPDCFQVKRGGRLKDKTLLLLDDVMTTGTTIEACSEALLHYYPHKIYALTFCRAIE